MAERSWSSKSLILSVKDLSENIRNVSLLIPNTQFDCCKIVDAAIFGGGKSKLRSLITPYKTGQIWLYTNPVKDSTKITDFDIIEYRLGLNENLTRIWCAGIASELALKLKGNIDWLIINSFLNGLAVSDEQACKSALLRFLWRIITFSGFAPDITFCGRCGEKNIPVTDNTTSHCFYYLPHENMCVCKNCLTQTEPNFKLSDRSIFYLFSITNLIPKISRNIQLSTDSYAELKHFLLHIISSIIGGELKSLTSGNFLF